MLFRALERQSGAGRLRFTLCLHLDSCSDGSAETASNAAAAVSYPVVIRVSAGSSAPNAGRARRTAMAMGLERLGGGRAGLLLTTDADSAPDPGWLAAAAEALRGADVVAGRLMRAGRRDATQDRVETYYDRLHALRRELDPVPWDPAPGHHFTGGANLGFRADAYVRLGGFQRRRAGEDALIVDTAARAGLRVRREPAMAVRTSARRTGRATGGLADGLRVLEQDGDDVVFVTHPADAAWQYRGQALARVAYENRFPAGELTALAARFGVSPKTLIDAAANCANAEAFAMRATPSAPHARRVRLAEAETALVELKRTQRMAA